MGSRRHKVEILHVKDLEVEPDEDTLQKLYMWVDEIPLSRPKKNMARDFSDAASTAEVIKFLIRKPGFIDVHNYQESNNLKAMAAELIQYFIPNGNLVQLHNYPAASSSNQKEQNWFHLNKKVLPKLNLDITPEVIRALSQCRTWVMENFLSILREKIDIYLAQNGMHKVGVDQEDLDAIALLDQPEVDQHTTGLGQMRRLTQPPGPGRAAVPLGRVRGRDVSPQGRAPPPAHHLPRGKGQASVPDNASYDNTQVPSIRGNVPRQLLDEKQHQVNLREETIQMLNDKVKKLEHLIMLKDMKVDEMTAKVQELNRTTNKKKPASKR